MSRAYGHLTVTTRPEFDDPKTSYYIKTVWIFTNTNEDCKSSIKNIQIWEERNSKITYIKVYLDPSGCQEVEQLFPDAKVYQGFWHYLHTEDDDEEVCSFWITNYGAMRNFLDCLIASYDLDSNAAGTLKIIYNRIKIQ